MIALVVLRITIGLHFSVEGINKFVDPKPFTAGFLVISKGPFAPLLKMMVWDKDGLARLDEDQAKRIWATYEQQAVRHFGLDPQGAQKAEAIRKQHEQELAWQLANDRADIDEYRKALKRFQDYSRDEARTDVAALRGQLESLEGELTIKRGKLLTPINNIWKSFELEINTLGASSGRNWLNVPKPGRQWMDTELIDVIIKYFDVLVGLSLITGLGARYAAIGGGLFLLSICASQWPFTPGAAPIWYQFIEAMAMAVLAATNAGQYAGFDCLLGPLRHWCCPPKQGTNA